MKLLIASEKDRRLSASDAIGTAERLSDAQAGEDGGIGQRGREQVDVE